MPGVLPLKWIGGQPTSIVSDVPRLRRSHAKIKAVATDMSAAYIKAVRDNLKKAAHVFDRFHVVKLFNDKLSAFRRQLYHLASSDHDRRILKGTRWLLLKNPENL